MDDKKLYERKKQAQLNELKADIDKLKAKVLISSLDAQIKINEHIRTLEHEFDETMIKLSELKKSADETYETIKTSVESACDKVASTFSDIKRKLKD